MLLLLLLALIAIALFGIGFAIHALWIIAVIVAVIWLLGFLFRAGAGADRARWYRW
jgi:hypothetical protein